VGDAIHLPVIDFLEVLTRTATAELLYIVTSVRKERHGKPSYAKKAVQQPNGLSIASGIGVRTDRGSVRRVAGARMAKWSSDGLVVRAEIRIDLAATTVVAHDATVVTSAVHPDLPEDSESESVIAISAASVRVYVATVAAAR
jgi:hypothetical protein